MAQASAIDFSRDPEKSGYSVYLKEQPDVPPGTWPTPDEPWNRYNLEPFIILSYPDPIRHLTVSEQRSFHRALRRSVKLVYQAKRA